MIREEAAKAAELVAEATWLTTLDTLAKAREKKHKMTVQAVLTLKAAQDKELAKMEEAKAARGELRHMEHVLVAAKEENMQLLASTDHARHVAQHIVDLEAGRLAEAAKEMAKAAREVKAMATYGTGLAPLGAATPIARAASHGSTVNPLWDPAPTLGNEVPALGDRESSPRPRSEEPCVCGRAGRPWGRPDYVIRPRSTRTSRIARGPHWRTVVVRQPARSLWTTCAPSPRS